MENVDLKLKGPESKRRKISGMEGILFGLGNPLVDIIADCDEQFLKKYDLKANDMISAEDKHMSLLKDMSSQYKVEYVPGGATQNSIRVAQWLIGVPWATSYVGCIGKDEFGEILKKKAAEAGMRVAYQYDNSHPTGTCAVLVTGKNRSLCTSLGAAKYFTRDHLNTEAVQKLMSIAKFFYISAFPVSVCPGAMLEVAKFASTQERKFILNLSASFLCKGYKEEMLQVIPYSDILFGNEKEALAFAKENNFETTDIKEITLKLSALPKFNGSRARMVVITQGAKPTIVVENAELKEFPTIHTDSEKIVDPHGAGDAFVGGFLAELVQGRDLGECIRGANYAASVLIQTSGCLLPEKNPQVSVNPGF